MKRRYRIKQEDGSTPRLVTVWLEDDGLDAPLLRDERPSRIVGSRSKNTSYEVFFVPAQRHPLGSTETRDGQFGSGKEGGSE